MSSVMGSGPTPPENPGSQPPSSRTGHGTTDASPWQGSTDASAEHGSTETTEYSDDPRTDLEPTGRAHALEPRFPDPGLPAHVYRRTDVDPKAAKRAERQVVGLFVLSIIGTVIFTIGYIAVPLHGQAEVRLSTRLLGGGLALSLFCIGVGAIHWAKKLMPDDEVVEERHPVRSTDEERAGAAAVLGDGAAAAGLPRRKMILFSLSGALGLLAIPTILPLGGLWTRNRGESPAAQISRTDWGPGVRLVRDPTGEPIRPGEVPIGAVVHVLPEVPKPHEGEGEGEHHELTLNQIAKDAVLLIRLEPEELEAPTRMDWTYSGLVAYSKICTHVGCPVGLYEQTTHHLLCPCHQSTFDVAHGARVVFGPAGHPLPQLALAVSPEGYLISQHDFTEPPGPSFWERG